MRAVPGEDAALLIDKSQKGSITTEVKLEESVTAPVSMGQKLGTMTIKAGDQVLRQIPMVAEAGVGRLSFGELFLYALRRLCMGA